MDKIPNSYSRGEWRNTTPVDIEGTVVRLAASIASANQLGESIQEFINSHSFISSGIPSSPGSIPLEGEKV